MTDRPEPEAMIADAAALSAPIVFREDGEQAKSEDPSPEALGLDDVIRLGLAHDPRIQAALSRVRMAGAEADQAELLPNPVLSVTLRRPTGGGRTIVEAMIGEDLLALIQRPGLIRAADQRLRAEAARAVEAALDTLAEVQEAYVKAQALDALVGEMVAQRGIVEQILELTQQRLTVAEGSFLDVSAAEQRHVELETELAERVLEQRQARLTLARLIGDPDGEAVWELTPWLPDLLTGTDESAWITTALILRPEIQAKHWELAALGTEEGLKWSAAIEGTEVGADMMREDGMSEVGPRVSFPLPLFDLGQAERRRAKSAVSQASHELTEVRRMVIEEVRSAYAAYLATRPIAEMVRRELVPLAELKLRLSESQFSSGDMGLIEVLLAEQELRMARTRLIELEQKSATSLIRLERAVGGPRVVAELSQSGPSAPSP